MSIKPSKENDKIRKKFINVWSKPFFPNLNREEWQKLEQLIVNYNDFKDDQEHKAGEVVLNDYHIKFEIKEEEKLVREKYLLLSCQEQDESK
ncbi:MAG: hypothetical protein E7021_02400 [Alphaproteobacteria bacterium]|nr:hypothetical protein [Alphaproteobacteria bacterium]